jgi:hypothetical protein
MYKRSLSIQNSIPPYAAHQYNDKLFNCAPNAKCETHYLCIPNTRSPGRRRLRRLSPPVILPVSAVGSCHGPPHSPLGGRGWGRRLPSSSPTRRWWWWSRSLPQILPASVSVPTARKYGNNYKSSNDRW